MSSLRSERARRRAARQRNQRIILILIAVLVLAFIAFLVYRSITTSQPSAASTTAGNMVVTASGLQYQDLVVGSGPEAKSGNTVSVHYTGWLADGTKFDSSLDRGTPFEFTLGAGQVIKGWDEGVVGMKVGGKRQLIIPPQLAYGSSGAGSTIPPNATLTFEVQLLEIK
jgi:peptidylprolyl isomerase